MCRRRNQAGRCGRKSILGSAITQTVSTTVPRPTSYSATGDHTTGVVILTKSVSNMDLADRKEAELSRNKLPPTYIDATEARLPPGPPAYNEISRTPVQGVPTPVMAAEALSQKTSFILPTSFRTTLSSNAHIESALNTLMQNLRTYRAGTGRKLPVRRARKALLNELYEDEVERRKAVRGGACLKCGERSMVWRDLKYGLGEQVSTLIDNARRERRQW